MQPEDVMDVYATTRRHALGQRLPVITLIDGVFDAGSAVATMRAVLKEGLTSTPLAEFDADLLVDHRASRPRISFKDGSFSDYTPPQLSIDLLTDDLGNQALLFSGAEPVIGWERISAAATGLLQELGAGPIAVVHSVPLPVPHTRPVSVRLHGDPASSAMGPFDLPASYSHQWEMRLKDAGMDVHGMTIQVPHYIADSEYPPAAVAGLEAIAGQAGLAVPTEELRELGRQVDSKIADQIEDNPDAARLVAGLEQRYDVETPQLTAAAPLLAEGQVMPDGDELAAAAERYLRSMQEEPAPDTARRDEERPGQRDASGTDEAEPFSEDEREGRGPGHSSRDS